jgi:hypothetical protein
MKKRTITQIFQSVLIVLILLSIVSFTEIKSEETTGPIIKNYSLPLQSWTFIQEVNLTANQVTKYVWESDITVQGREVTVSQYNTIQGLSLSERSSYFETIGYFDGIQDSGKTITDVNGSLFFVFFNPNPTAANLDVTYTYQISNLQPWAIGLIAGVFGLVFIVGGIYFAARVRRRMLKEAEEESEPSAAERYMNM